MAFIIQGAGDVGLIGNPLGAEDIGLIGNPQGECCCNVSVEYELCTGTGPNKFVDSGAITDPPPGALVIGGVCYSLVGPSNTPPEVLVLGDEFVNCLDCNPTSVEYLECPSGATIFVNPSLLDNPPWPLAVEISSVCYEFVQVSLTAPDTFSIDEQFNECDPGETCCCTTGVVWRYCIDDTVFGAMPPNHVPQDFCWSHPVAIDPTRRPSEIYRATGFDQPVIEPCFIVNQSTVRDSCASMDFTDFNEPWLTSFTNNASLSEVPFCYFQITTPGASSVSTTGSGTLNTLGRGFSFQTTGEWILDEFTGGIDGVFSVEITTSNVSYAGGGFGNENRWYELRVGPYRIRIEIDGSGSEASFAGTLSSNTDISGSVSFGAHTLRIERDAFDDIRLKVNGTTHHTVNDASQFVGVGLRAFSRHATGGAFGITVDWSPIAWTGG